MPNRKEKEMNEQMPLSRLIDMNEVKETPQLAAVIMRRISHEAQQLMNTDMGDRSLKNHLFFLEETVCELVTLVSSLEMENMERRRLLRIHR